MPYRQLPSHPRRPRVHFDPSRARIYEMGMIQHGWETLEALHRFRYLTSWQVAKLLFLGRPNLAGQDRGAEAARKAANERCLRRLKDRQLIQTRQAMLTHRSTWKRQEYNVLTHLGHLLLCDRLVARGVTPPEWDPTRSEIAPEILAHALGLNDVGIAFARSAEFHQGQLDGWIDDFAARRARGQVQTGTLIPDAAAVLHLPNRRVLAFIELDRGTEPVASPALNSWRTKVARYGAYLEREFHTDPFFAGFSSALVLSVTTSPTRLAHLLEETERGHPAREHWWFALSDWLEPPFDALGPIWQRPHAPGCFFSLLDEMALRSA